MINYYDEIKYRQEHIKNLEWLILEAKENRLFVEINKIKSQKKRTQWIEGYKKHNTFDYDKHLQDIENMKQTISKLNAEIDDLQTQWNVLKSNSHSDMKSYINTNTNTSLCDRIWNRREGR